MGYFSSSIGRKQIMGLTGLGLSGFVFAHMAGNLLILVGADAYNKYGHALISNPLIYLAEAGLVGMFVVHAIVAFQLTIENRAARKQKYARCTNGEKAVHPASKSMIFHGSILLIFTIHHLMTFKYGTVYETTVDGVVMRDLHRLVIEIFKQPAYVVWYCLALLGLGMHLSHGFSSSFQSMGFNHPTYTPWIKRFGVLYAIVVAAGFIAQPVAVYFMMK